MLWTKECANTSPCLPEDRRRRAQRPIDAGRMGQQPYVSSRNQANRVRITIGNAVEACPNARQSASPMAGASFVSPAKR